VFILPKQLQQHAVKEVVHQWVGAKQQEEHRQSEHHRPRVSVVCEHIKAVLGDLSVKGWVCVSEVVVSKSVAYESYVAHAAAESVGNKN